MTAAISSNTVLSLLTNQATSHDLYYRFVQLAGEDNKKGLIALLCETFTEAMQSQTVSKPRWAAIKTLLKLVSDRYKPEPQCWTDLERDRRTYLLPSFLPALVRASGLHDRKSSDDDIGGFFFGVLQPWASHDRIRKVHPQLLEALSCASSRQYGLAHIFWDALDCQLQNQYSIGIVVEGALQLTSDQVWYVVNEKGEGRSLPPNVLAKNIMIDGKVHPLSCLLARSKQARELYLRTESVEQVVALLQQLIPSKELREIVIHKCVLGSSDFQAFMLTYNVHEDLKKLRALFKEVSAMLEVIGGPSVLPDELTRDLLRYWISDADVAYKDRAFWHVSLAGNNLQLKTIYASKVNDRFITLLHNADGLQVTLDIKVEKLPIAIREALKNCKNVQVLTDGRWEDFPANDAVDPVIGTLQALEQLTLNTTIKDITALQYNTNLQQLKIGCLALNNIDIVAFPSSVSDLEISELKGAAGIKQVNYPVALRRFDVRGAFCLAGPDLSNLPATVESVKADGHPLWVHTISNRLVDLSRLTYLFLALVDYNQEGNPPPLSEPMHILAKMPRLDELWLEGGVTYADVGNAPKNAQIRKITLIPFSFDSYNPESWIASLHAISTLKEFQTIGPHGPHNMFRRAGEIIGCQTEDVMIVRALATAAKAVKIGFTINSKTAEFLLENVKEPKKSYW